ncbi:MAG TPA: serine/threonine-protein kinase, partial [Thermoanaerobaculia bacterium]|nr:serine/threonine-protein kinase [Thermoanaerobaculia bacterium]
GRLGIGGMGEVFKVLHIHLNRIRVVKLMRSSLERDSDAHHRFVREARLATRIQHPNVATLFDFSILPDGSNYMVWEFIDGVTLAQRLRAERFLSPRYAAEIAVQTLAGLEAIHRAGIVHRDMSPENVMLTKNEDGDERVKIIDLGIAKEWMDEDEERTKTGMFVGKWKYCSPEQLGVLGKGERIDARADLYSLGIVLYEMLTGHPPFLAMSPHDFLVAHSTEKPRPLREANRELEGFAALEPIVMRALEKDREARFASAREFRLALEGVRGELADRPGFGFEQLLRTEVTPLPEAPVPPSRVVDPYKTLRGETARVDSHDAPTLVETTPAAGRETVRVRTGPGRRRAALAAVAVALAVIGGLGYMFARQRAAAGSVEMSGTAAAATLAVDAYPWGEIVSVRDLATGSLVDVGKVTTPAALDLPAGSYEVVVRNPAYRNLLTQQVSLAGGEARRVHLQFVEASAASMPELVEK